MNWFADMQSAYLTNLLTDGKLLPESRPSRDMERLICMYSKSLKTESAVVFPPGYPCKLGIKLALIHLREISSTATTTVCRSSCVLPIFLPSSGGQIDIEHAKGAFPLRRSACSRQKPRKWVRLP